MKILIVSFLFAPTNNIGAKRVTKVAEYLNSVGHDVRVLTARQKFNQHRVIHNIPVGKIYYTNWLDVNKPFYWLKNESLEPSVGKERVPLFESGFKQSVYQYLRAIYKRILHRPDSVVGWIPYAVFGAISGLKEWSPDVIYGSAPPYTSLVISKILAWYYKVPWVAELRDLWKDNPAQRTDFIDRWLERSVLANATAIVVVSTDMARKLVRNYLQPCYVVRNAFDQEDYCDLPKNSLDDSFLNITYTGVVYKGRQDPSILFAAIAGSEELRRKVRVHFYGRGNEWIKNLVNEFGLSQSVEVYGVVGHQEALSIQKNSDLLLLMTWNDPLQKGVLSGKLFEYIGSVRHILCVGDFEDEATRIVRRMKFGSVFHDVSALASFLLSNCNDKDEIYSKNNSFRGCFIRDRQSRKIDRILQQCVNKSNNNKL